MLLDYHIPPAVYVGRIDRIAPLTACFVYIPFANEKRVLEGGSKPALVWMINPGPALIRLQTSIYNAALNVGIPISEYSVPGIFTPHITAAYNLERVPEDRKSVV